MSTLPLNSGSLGAAMVAAGIDTGKARLFTAAVEALRTGEAQALGAFLATLHADESLQAALAREHLVALARQYLLDRSADLAGQTKGEAGGRKYSEAHVGDVTGASPNLFPDDVHHVDEAHAHIAVVGANPSRSDGGRGRVEVPTSSAPVAPAPRPDRREAIAAMRAVVRPSLFDSYVTREGSPIGDLPWCTLERLITTNARETHVLRRVREYGRPADPNDIVRNIVPERLIAEAIEEAKRLND